MTTPLPEWPPRALTGYDEPVWADKCGGFPAFDTPTRPVKLLRRDGTVARWMPSSNVSLSAVLTQPVPNPVVSYAILRPLAERAAGVVAQTMRSFEADPGPIDMIDEADPRAARVAEAYDALFPSTESTAEMVHRVSVLWRLTE